MCGTLTLCGVPIGNLGDITLRALEILKTVDYIAAEDTRHTQKLLNACEIQTPLISYHAHSSTKKADQLIDLLLSGKNIALVTDAGMPCISDPGSALIQQCYAQNITVTAAPGPSACITGLALSGLAADRFVFEGFLPSHLRQKKARKKRLAEIAAEKRAVVLYEAPHHLQVTLADLAAVIGTRKMAAARELTKRYEEVVQGTASELLTHFEATPPRGEFVLVIEASAQEAETTPLEAASASGSPALLPPEAWLAQIAAYKADGHDEMTAIKRAAHDFAVGKREMYKVWTAHKQAGQTCQSTMCLVEVDAEVP